MLPKIVIDEQNIGPYRFGEFEIDPANRRFRRGEEQINLPARAFDLLVTLVENRGRLVGKDELFERVWRGQIVEESNLTVYISQIRKALGESAQSPRYIETVPGYGYRFIGELDGPHEEEYVVGPSQGGKGEPEKYMTIIRYRVHKMAKK